MCLLELLEFSWIHSQVLSRGPAVSWCALWSDTVEGGRQSSPSRPQIQTSPSLVQAHANILSHPEESTPAAHTPDDTTETEYMNTNMNHKYHLVSKEQN